MIDLIMKAYKAIILYRYKAGVAYILIALDELDEGFILIIWEPVSFDDVPIFQLVPAVKWGILVYFKLALRGMTCRYI